MSDKFLNTGGSGNANISNGTINAFVAGITVANLKASMPIKTNSVNTLVSSRLDISDINNLESRLDDAKGLTNPYVGTIKATDFETDDYFSINTELQKIDNFTASTATDTNITGIVKVPEVATGRLYDSTQATWLELDGIDVAISATDLTLNGSSVISEVGGKNLVNTLTTTQTAFTLDQELITKKYFIDNLPGTDDLDTKTQNISLTTTAGNTISTGDQQFLLGNLVGGSTFSIASGAVGDPFYSRIMDMTSLGINTVAALNTGVIRPDVNNTRDIGTLSLKYKDMFINKINCGLIDNQNGTIVNVSDPTDLQDVATKKYVDDNVGGVDFNITSVVDKDLLQYDNASSKWVNRTISEASIGTELLVDRIVASNEGTVAGNARGQYSVDLQQSRANATEVATGIGSVGLGRDNTITGDYGFACGSFNVSTGEHNFIGGASNTSVGQHNLCGGSGNTSTSYNLCGGSGNYCNSYNIVAGFGNTCTGQYNGCSGRSNNVSSSYSFTSGQNNTNSANYSICSGMFNNVSGKYSIAMGQENTTAGDRSFALGSNNVASANYCGALGYYAEAKDQGSFVWADNSAATLFQSNSVNSFNIRAAGGINLETPVNATSRTASTYLPIIVNGTQYYIPLYI